MQKTMKFLKLIIFEFFTQSPFKVSFFEHRFHTVSSKSSLTSCIQISIMHLKFYSAMIIAKALPLQFYLNCVIFSLLNEISFLSLSSSGSLDTTLTQKSLLDYFDRSLFSSCFHLLLFIIQIFHVHFGHGVCSFPVLLSFAVCFVTFLPVSLRS